MNKLTPAQELINRRDTTIARIDRQARVYIFSANNKEQEAARLLSAFVDNPAREDLKMNWMILQEDITWERAAAAELYRRRDALLPPGQNGERTKVDENGRNMTKYD